MHAFFNRQFGLPTQGKQFLCIQKDKWTVANPAARPAAVNKPGMIAQRLTNPANRIVNLAVFMCTEVKYIHLFLSLGMDQQNGIDAVLHVKVRLALVPVP